jgi:hypothetical protein
MELVRLGVELKQWLRLTEAAEVAGISTRRLLDEAINKVCSALLDEQDLTVTRADDTIGLPEWKPCLVGRFVVQSGPDGKTWVMPAQATDRFVRVLDRDTGLELVSDNLDQSSRTHTEGEISEMGRKYLVWDDEGRGRDEALPFYIDELQGESAEYEQAAIAYGQHEFHGEPFEEKRCFVVRADREEELHTVDVFVEMEPEFEAMDVTKIAPKARTP